MEKLVSQKVKRYASRTGYEYATIRMTKSRLDKGLIAIPKALSVLFPKTRGNVNLYLDNSRILLCKVYSSYDSSTRECRIGGMRDWFEKKRIETGDEIVIQVIDKDKNIYRISMEKDFVSNTLKLQKRFDNARQIDQAEKTLGNLVTLANVDLDIGPLIELSRLAHTELRSGRRTLPADKRRARERVPIHFRVLFEKVYKGHCQLCDFWFPKRDNRPYFEIHHVDPLLGHHPQNLVVVCGNCHNQFEHAKSSLRFDSFGWLRHVRFNDKHHKVYQALLETKLKPAQKSLYL